MVNDLVLQVDGGHVLRVGHGHGEQDAHEQVDHLERQAKGGGSADDTAAPPGTKKIQLEPKTDGK